MKRRWISKLKFNEHVVCRVPSHQLDQVIEEDCNFIKAYPERKKILVGYLDGYRSESAFVDYNDVLAVFDPNGEYMTFDDGCLSGRSALLIKR